MQIVIDIPKEQYSLIMQSHRAGAERFVSKEAMMYAIKNGTPLPKGHGRLIDADDLIQELSVVSSRPIKSQLYILRNAPTIIEADKESEE